MRCVGPVGPWWLGAASRRGLLAVQLPPGARCWRRCRRGHLRCRAPQALTSSGIRGRVMRSERVIAGNRTRAAPRLGKKIRLTLGPTSVGRPLHGQDSTYRHPRRRRRADGNLPAGSVRAAVRAAPRQRPNRPDRRRHQHHAAAAALPAAGRRSSPASSTSGSPSRTAGHAQRLVAHGATELPQLQWATRTTRPSTCLPKA